MTTRLAFHGIVLKSVIGQSCSNTLVPPISASPTRITSPNTSLTLMSTPSPGTPASLSLHRNVPSQYFCIVQRQPPCWAIFLHILHWLFLSTVGIFSPFVWLKRLEYFSFLPISPSSHPHHAPFVTFLILVTAFERYFLFWPWKWKLWLVSARMFDTICYRKLDNERKVKGLLNWGH